MCHLTSSFCIGDSKDKPTQHIETRMFCPTLRNNVPWVQSALESESGQASKQPGMQECHFHSGTDVLHVCGLIRSDTNVFIKESRTPPLKDPIQKIYTRADGIKQHIQKICMI